MLYNPVHAPWQYLFIIISVFSLFCETCLQRDLSMPTCLNASLRDRRGQLLGHLLEVVRVGAERGPELLARVGEDVVGRKVGEGR